MLKAKWKKLLLREKILLISGIVFIVSVPLSSITLYFMAIAMTFFGLSIFYNLYKFIQTTILLDISINCFGWKRYDKTYNFMGFESNLKNAVRKNKNYPVRKKIHYYDRNR